MRRRKKCYYRRGILDRKIKKNWCSISGNHCRRALGHCPHSNDRRRDGNFRKRTIRRCYFPRPPKEHHPWCRGWCSDVIIRV
jgi:hypothetical protein